MVAHRLRSLLARWLQRLAEAVRPREAPAATVGANEHWLSVVRERAPELLTGGGIRAGGGGPASGPLPRGGREPLDWPSHRREPPYTAPEASRPRPAPARRGPLWPVTMARVGSRRVQWRLRRRPDVAVAVTEPPAEKAALPETVTDAVRRPVVRPAPGFSPRTARQRERTAATADAGPSPEVPPEFDGLRARNPHGPRFPVAGPRPDAVTGAGPAVRASARPRPEIDAPSPGNWPELPDDGGQWRPAPSVFDAAHLRTLDDEQRGR